MKDWLTFLRIIQKASKNGVFFPKGTDPLPSPLGSYEIPTHGGVLQRIRHEVGWFRICHHRCPIKGLQEKISILHLTDIHIRKDSSWLKHLCQQLQGMKPDLVAITGDVVAQGWEKSAVHRFLNAIPSARLGRYAVMGNWEYWAAAPPLKWKGILSSYNIKLLRDSWVELPPFTLLGTDDHLAGTSHPETLLPQLPNRVTITLSHSPALFPRLAKPPIQLVLSGHSHGGQFRPPFLGALWVPRGTGQYISGWYQQNDTYLFVSRGIGWSIAPLRLRCPPEIAWIQLIPSS